MYSKMRIVRSVKKSIQQVRIKLIHNNNSNNIKKSPNKKPPQKIKVKTLLELFMLDSFL